MRKMRTAAFAAQLFLLTFFVFDTAKAQLSFVVGANYGELSDISFGDETASFESATGYHLGLTYELRLILITIRPGIFYRQFGDIKLSGDDAGSELDDLNLTFIDVPIDVMLRLGIIPIVKPFLLVGPVFNFPSASESSFDDAFNSFATSLAVGAGITVRLLGISVTPELRYEFGISSLVDEHYDFGGGPELILDSDPPNSFIARLGIGF